MNYKIANQEVCKALINGELVRGYDVDNDTVFVTVDGCCGFIIPKSAIVYDITKIKQVRKLLDFSDYIKPENEIKQTKNYIKVGKKFCCRFDGKDWQLFVNDYFLKKLDKENNYCFFQNYKEGKDMRKQNILAAAKTYDSKDNELKYITVMVFLPVIILDYEEK